MSQQSIIESNAVHEQEQTQKVHVSIILVNAENDTAPAKVLSSIRQQLYQEYETLIIGYPSEDENLKRLCESDQRFRVFSESVEDLGNTVNQAISEAQGEFILFLSKNVILYEEALRKMVPKIKQTGADLLLTALDYYDVCGKRALHPCPFFSVDEYTEKDRYDPSWNLVDDIEGILFRKSLIIERGIRFFEGTSRAKRMFLMNCLMETHNEIPILNTHYMKRKMGRAMLFAVRQNDIPTSFRLGVEEFHSLLDKLDKNIEQDEAGLLDEKGMGSYDWLELRYRHIAFRSEFIYEFTQNILLRRYYARIWQTNGAICDEIRETLHACMEQMLPTDVERLIEENPDLKLDQELFSMEQILEEPVLSVLVTDHVSKEALPEILDALYWQDLPAFELMVDDSLEELVADEIKAMPNMRFWPHNEDLRVFCREALADMKGTHALFVHEDLIPTEHILSDMFRMQDNKTMTSAQLLRKKGKGFEAVTPHDAVFVNELTVVRLRSPFNRLDWMWGNKIFNVKTLLSRKVLFDKGPDPDMDRLYNNSSLQKVTERGFVTAISDREVCARAGVVARTGYKKLLRDERKRLAMHEHESTRIETLNQKKKKLQEKAKKYVFKASTSKFFYPMQYQAARREKLDPKKVIFVVPRHDYLPNSMEYMYETIKASGKYDIKIHYLNELKLRYRQQFEVNMAFVKDMATAHYVFLDDYIPCLGGFTKRPETKVIQLWHGCGAFKKFGYSTADKIFGSSAAVQKQFKNYANHDVVTVSSPEVVWAYEEAMLMQGENIVQPLGVSRTDVFFDEDYIRAAKERVIERVPAAAEKKIILYAPTFRGSVANAQGPDMIDHAMMYEALGDEYIILNKHHPFVKQLPAIHDDYRESFVYDVTHDLSIEDLICASDICISDYSSLVFEYSLFERPIIMFAYDLEDYFDWRGFYYDYYDMSPGPIVQTTEEIIDYIGHLDTEFDREKMLAFKEKFMSSCDGHATKRILDYVGLEL